MFDLHRHDEYSSFDGFGSAKDLAKLAKELGHSALSTSNHGNTNGLIKTYLACKKEEINCILGVECYFQPKKYSEDVRAEKKRYHLCLFAKNLKGYENMNAIMYESEKNKYYKPITTFKMLEERSEGLICTSACMAGMLSQALEQNKIKTARKIIERFKDIFGEDYYIEIQPYKVDEDGTQEKVNRKLIELAIEYDIKMVPTSDSHYGRKEDWETYLKMHEIGKTKYDVFATYHERYMPTKKEMLNRLRKMHEKDFKELGLDPKKEIMKMFKNLDEIENKVEQNYLDSLEEELPVIDDAEERLKVELKKGLKRIGKHKNKKYLKRVKEEFEVLKMHGFADYFLIVQDYVRHAKEDLKINVGPGRGSVCNCEIAYLLGITNVDSIKFGLDFRRFLREDKTKLPDVDLDFETSRRQEVIDYLIRKYNGRAAQICSYGLYKVDNLVNDLAKVCGLTEEETGYETSELKAKKKEIKKFINDNLDENENFKYDENNSYIQEINDDYDDLFLHFSKLYKQVRFIGTHAAGVAITRTSLDKYCARRIQKDKETGFLREFTSYDLNDMDTVHVVKFDMLGLKTMESLGDMRKITGNGEMPDEYLEDPELMKHFREGDTDGVFQFDTDCPRGILKNIEADCFEDIVAASSMNRPGPLGMKMPDTYAYNKLHKDTAKHDAFYEYTKETYGSVVYQEQVQLMCVEVGGLTWKEADRVMKLMKNAIASMGEMAKINKDKHDLTEKFIAGAVERGYKEKDAREMFEKVLVYTFNKGHGVGYGMISVEEMYYKVNYPAVYWSVKLKYCNDDALAARMKEKAVMQDLLIFLPHVNYGANYSLRKIEGEDVIQEGLSSIKGVGEKAAQLIENERKANGPFKSLDEFKKRCVDGYKRSPVNKGVIEKLKENGALEFNKKTYISRVTKWNSSLYARGLSRK